LLFGLNAARHLSFLDWAGFADHVSNKRCELARWKEQVAQANAYDDAPNFVTLPAYEASLSGGKGGDNNVYMTKFPSLFVDENDQGDVISLCKALSEKAKQEDFDFFVVPHHTTRTGKHGEIPDEIYPGKKMMPVIEIHSKWGTSEYRGNPDPLKEIHHGPSYAVDMLNRGLRLGFIGGTDTHNTLTFIGFEKSEHLARLPGLTGIISEKLDRNSIFEAIRNRRCYATSGERIFLDFNINGIAMGQESDKPEKNRKISINTAACSDISTVEMIRNGEVLKTYNPKSFSFSGSLEDSESFDDICIKTQNRGSFIYYYVRVRCVSGAAAWSSPIWFSN